MSAKNSTERRRSAYGVSTNFTDGHGCGVLARSWKGALEEAIAWRPILAVFRGVVPKRQRWGWRLDRGENVVCIELRRRK